VISMHSMSVPPYRQMLTNLLAWLDKAEAHARAKSFDSAVYLPMRLAPDMLPFGAQVVVACEVAKMGLSRLAAVEPPSWAGDIKSLDDLRGRLRLAIDYVASFDVARLAESASRPLDVTPQRGGATLHFEGEGFLKHYSLPNFYFHVTTAYALLRHAGVDLGKSDYLALA
jgi:hypothetical protein